MEKLLMHSPDLTQEHIARLRELFPDCVTEARDADGRLRLAVDFDQLRQELSDSIVEGPQERYRLDWPGKREALLAANAPIAKTLRPCRAESVDFDTTQNLFIEGDNLEALKLLQKSYLGKVKMIYIDPPYNTGNDFIYNDVFSTSKDDFDLVSRVRDEQGNKLLDQERWRQNSAANGRFHSNWLSMIYPRIKLSKHILRDDGLIFISIDDCEMHNLRKLCDEIFGSENFVGFFIWKSRISEDTRAKTGLSTDHEYIVCYKNAGDVSLRGSKKDISKFDNPDNDKRGPWRSADMTGLATKDKRPNLHYNLINPESGIDYGCPPKGWRFDKNSMIQKIAERRVIWPTSDAGRPRQKLFLNEMESTFKNISSVIQKISTADGTREVNALLGNAVFVFPKPAKLIELFVEQATDSQSIVLDFFSGSCTSAHAVMQLNAEDGGNRKFIMVQLPEPCDKTSEAYKAGYTTIAEIGKERIRRAGKKILEGTCHEGWNKDVGFRVLKVDTSNMADVYYTPDALQQDHLLSLTENIKPDRSPEDLLFQVLLDWGLDPCLPIRRETIQGKTVFFVNTPPYDLIACFDSGVDEALVKELADYKPVHAVFRDTGFASDAVKINVEQIFQQLSPDTVVKAI